MDVSSYAKPISRGGMTAGSGISISRCFCKSSRMKSDMIHATPKSILAKSIRSSILLTSNIFCGFSPIDAKKLST